MENRRIIDILNTYFLKRVFGICILFFSSIYCEIKESDKILLETVSQRMLFVLKSQSKNLDAAVSFSIVDTSIIDSYIRKNKNNSFNLFITGRVFKDFIKNSPDKLAFIIGHEIAHITCGHYQKHVNDKNKFASFLYSREEEQEADVEGMKTALKAGYSYSEIIKLLKEFKYFGDISSLEALSSGHPSWTQRLEHLDSSRSVLWHSMGAFENGVYFLFFENYEAAAVCFEKVIDEFPDCIEAYADCGYAYLMRYIDGFDQDDIKLYNTGQIVIGGFYRRPGSLDIKLRGINEDLWYDAVSYLEKALSYNNNLALVKSNLGIAYLLDPRRKSLSRSKKYFNEALELIKTDTTIDPVIKGIICLNSGASDLSIDNLNDAVVKLKNAQVYFNSNDPNPNDMRLAGISPDNSASICNALKYNYTEIRNAVLLNNTIIKLKNSSCSQPDYQSQKDLLYYLHSSNHASVWWNYAYDLYCDICKKNESLPEKKELLLKEKLENIIKPVTSINFKNGKSIYLSEKLSEVNESFGEFNRIPIVRERKIAKYIFPGNNFEIIGTDEVMAIILSEDNSSSVIIKLNDTEIKPGMKKNEMENILRNISRSSLQIPGITGKIVFYDQAGLAFQFSNDTIKKIIIVQVPTQP